MSSPEEKSRHRQRMKRKQKDKPTRTQSRIAKDLLVSGEYKQRVVKDKRGRTHDLDKLDHKTLVDLIQELDE